MANLIKIEVGPFDNIRREYYDNGTIKKIFFSGVYDVIDINGRLNNPEGPAQQDIISITHDKVTSNVIMYLWFFHGEKINCSSQEEFEKMIKLKAFW